MRKNIIELCICIITLSPIFRHYISILFHVGYHIQILFLLLSSWFEQVICTELVTDVTSMRRDLMRISADHSTSQIL